MESQQIASRLSIIISALHKGLRKQMQTVNQYSLTELETIGHLMKNESLLATEIAAKTRITTQSMSQILKKLEAQNIIHRTQSITDKRTANISISTHGKELVEHTHMNRNGWLQALIEEKLTVKEIESLAEVMPILNKLITIN